MVYALLYVWKEEQKKKTTHNKPKMMNYIQNKIFALNFLRVRHRQNES